MAIYYWQLALVYAALLGVGYVYYFVFVESKKTIMAAIKPQIDAARERENAAFAYLMGRPANMEAMVALAERRQPDFAAIDLADS